MEAETIRVSLEGSDPVYFPRIQRKPVGDRHKHRPSELAVIRAEGSPACRTGYTPKTGNMTLSPVMLVAEQIPVAKSKHVRKPARLVLRERNDMRPVAIAVKAQDSHVSTHAELVSGAASQSASGESAENGTVCALKPVTTLYVQAPSPVTAEPTGPIPEPPSRSASSTFNHNPSGSSGQHLPSSSCPPILWQMAPKALAIPSTASRSSRASVSSTSTCRDGRIEARLEALERENKLLEAALMAVLKTSGTLNRCPCALEKGDERGALDAYLETRVGGGIA